KGPFPFLISTTSENVERLRVSAQFIPELFYRISAYRVSLPPLRERRPDIPQLFSLMVSDIGRQLGLAAAVPKTRVMEALMDYSWPGNLRELENVAREFLLAPDSAALAAEIEERCRTVSRIEPRERPALKEQVKQASKRVEGEIILRTLEQ